MIEKEPIHLSKEYQYTLDLLEKTNQSMFITGRAGTGKSTLLQLFRDTTQKRAVVLAPTGVAALNVKGQTIHSFFGFPGKPLQKSDIRRRRYRKIFEKLQVLIIDEISMVRADMLDNIDYFLRLNRHINQPFGGVQVVFFGDLFQLPPVVATEEEHRLFRDYYDSPYFFSAKVFVEENFEMEKVELRTTYRQSSRNFVRLLDAVRLNQVDYDDLDDLNERYFEEFDAEDYYITLS
ncbi:MAG: ATP-dependent DNA helicase PIF1, partial [Nonlabens sp.]